jgi:AcrR family transcriptional regulator
MGRKSIEKERLVLEDEQKEWINKLTQLFLKNGIKKVSMDRVVVHLGVSKATFYRFFESRDILIERIIENYLQQFDGFEKILHNEEKDYFERFVETFAFFSKPLIGLNNAFLRDLKEYYPKQLEKITQFQNKILEELAKYYKTGIEKKYIVDSNIHILLAMDKAMIWQLTDGSFLQKNQLSISEAFEQYFRIKFQGLIPRDHGK